MLPEANCCPQPKLRPFVVLGDSPAGEVVLERCAACKTYWQVTTPTRPQSDGEAEPVIQTYTKLTEEEGNRALYGME
jgi:hypothetical protein